MFIDQAKVYVKGGDGGKGCKSLQRDKYSRYGKPDGGDGGRGADVIIRADRHLNTLLDYKYQRHFSGAHGGHGSSRRKKGRNAEPLTIRVPVGTRILDAESGFLLRDLVQEGEEFTAARGGKGGIGNDRVEDTVPAQPGEAKELIFDLSLIAEVGIVGFPNAGKSTLVSSVSNAHPKTAAYPFTTKAPCLGIVRIKDMNFSIADIPGLIEGSSHGKGLGDRFLRHVERTKVLVHLIDMAGVDGRDPLEDYRIINKELAGYGKGLLKKPQVLAANKMDLEGASGNLKRFKAKIKRKIFPVSALEKEGLEDLIEAVSKKL